MSYVPSPAAGLALIKLVKEYEASADEERRACINLAERLENMAGEERTKSKGRRMSDIPEDIMKAARKHCDLAGVTPHSDMRVHCEHVAAFAILAERERCAKIADGKVFRMLIDGVGAERKQAIINAKNEIALAIADEITNGGDK